MSTRRLRYGLGTRHNELLPVAKPSAEPTGAATLSSRRRHGRIQPMKSPETEMVISTDLKLHVHRQAVLLSVAETHEHHLGQKHHAQAAQAHAEDGETTSRTTGSLASVPFRMMILSFGNVMPALKASLVTTEITPKRQKLASGVLRLTAKPTRGGANTHVMAPDLQVMIRPLACPAHTAVWN